MQTKKPSTLRKILLSKRILTIGTKKMISKELFLACSCDWKRFIQHEFPTYRIGEFDQGND
jgi:hypothetical protein